jgi:predicted ATPase
MAIRYITEIGINEQGMNRSAYPYSLPVVRHLADFGRLPLRKPVTFFAGENGTGKSTLLEAVAVAYGFNPEGGSKNFCFSTKSTHSSLHEHLSLSKSPTRPEDGYFLRAESFYNVATEADNLGVRGYGGKSLHEQSHGESFLALLNHRFSGNGLYLLDEPEAALSPSRQLTVSSLLHDLVKTSSQFIIATHSPILLAYPDADIYALTDDGIELTAYKETEHYTLTKNFLDSPERMLRHLLI